MSRRVIRTFAIWLMVLGISPFTAPFATCDLTVPVSDSSSHGDLWVKPATDTDKAPAIGSTTARATPLFLVIAAVPVGTTSGARHSSPSRLILRI